jgi:hypothetical protein
MEIKEFTDKDGRKRIFEFKQFSVPTGFAYKAVEIQDGEPICFYPFESPNNLTSFGYLGITPINEMPKCQLS